MNREHDWPVWFFGNDFYFKTWDWYDMDLNLYINYFLYTDKKLDDPDFIRTNTARGIIYPKDIEIIFGCSHEDACSLLSKIRCIAGNPVSHPVLRDEFCNETGLDIEIVKAFIKESNYPID
jgi:hypothetical protein